jgi:hypothetical protein
VKRADGVCLKNGIVFTHDGLWPSFAVLPYNGGAVLLFLQGKNPFSLSCEGVFPSVLRYVLPRYNLQPQGMPALWQLHGRDRTSGRVSISGNDPRT